MRDRRTPEVWFRDRAALSFIGTRYLPWLAALNLAWELAQLPLYTIWREQSAGYAAFAVAPEQAGTAFVPDRTGQIFCSHECQRKDDKDRPRP